MSRAVFIQGMRRSGTTIAFDIFWEDRRLDSHYEPLREDRETPGGGSGAHDYDFIEKIREYRKRFMASEGVELPMEAFNYGAPHDPTLEFDANFSPLIERYIAFLLKQSENTLLKETRLMAKAGALHAIAPDSHFIHVVRDPRLVATSYIFGKNRKNEAKYSDPEIFFNRTSEKSAWSSYPFTEILLASPEYAHLRGQCTDLMRMMLLWAHNFRLTDRDGKEAFGDRYLLVRHEDLLFDTEATITRIYDHIGLEADSDVIAWANENVRRKPLNYHVPGDPRWLEAMERVGMVAALQEAGYPLQVAGADDLTASSSL